MNGSLRELIIQKKFFRQKNFFFENFPKIFVWNDPTYFFSKKIIDNNLQTNPANFFCRWNWTYFSYICVQKFVLKSSWFTVCPGRIIHVSIVWSALNNYYYHHYFYCYYYNYYCYYYQYWFIIFIVFIISKFCHIF